MQTRSHPHRSVSFGPILVLTLSVFTGLSAQDRVPLVTPVEGQPLGANVTRLLQTLEYLGAPLPAETARALGQAARGRDAGKLQTLLDPHVLFVVSLNPEVRVKVARGPTRAILQQGGFTPLLVKILNDSTVTRQLEITSPQSGPVYSGPSLLILKRQAQTELKKDENVDRRTDDQATVAQPADTDIGVGARRSETCLRSGDPDVPANRRGGTIG